MNKIQSAGKCHLCGEAVGRASVTRHLTACNQPQASGAVSAGEQQPRPSFHIVVEGRDAKVYWMHLAVPVTARLSDLDRFLRDVWLECCGHMSAFEINGNRYASARMEGEMSTKTPLRGVLDLGTKFFYEYDFGSTTELVLKVVALRQQGTPKCAVQLLARNEAPQVSCQQCGAHPATQVCT